MSRGVHPSPPPPGTAGAFSERHGAGRGLWVPALLASLVLLTVIGGIAISQLYWRDLRSSMSRMDQILRHARERQRQMVEHFSEAQSLLIAQQRHLKEQEEKVRAREATIAAERAALEDARTWLAQPATSGQAVERQIQARDLARRLDISLSGIAEPGGLESAAETLDAVTDWAARSGPGIESPLHAALVSALAAARGALADAHPEKPAQLSERLERLGADASRLTPGAAAGPSSSPAMDLASGAGPGHLGEQIQTALFAVRRGDEALFRLALDTAQAWLAAFYDLGRPDVAAVQAEIGALRRFPVRQDLDQPRNAAARVRAVLGEIIQRTKTAEQTGGLPAVSGGQAED